MQKAIQLAQEFLMESHIPGAGWGYHSQSPQAYPEPTCYSLLALTDTSFSPTDSLNWLSSLVNSDGQLILPNDDSPNWGTAHLIITLSRLNQLPETRQSSIKWLLTWQSNYVETSEVVMLDGDLIGWPWISDTFSWVQPTSYATLALKLSDLKSHKRVKDAEALLFDRMCVQGGWNFGNPIILGRQIDPEPADTAIAMIALQGVHEAAEAIEIGLSYLEDTLPRENSTLSLALSILCMGVFDRSVDQFVELLIARQDPDGSWGGMPWWTALGVLALQSAAGEENVFQV